MPYKDPEKKRAWDLAYYEAHREHKKAIVAAYRATTAGILSEERHYQKRKRGDAHVRED